MYDRSTMDWSVFSAVERDLGRVGGAWGRRRLPARWIGKVEVLTRDGRRVQGRVDEPRGSEQHAAPRRARDQALALAAYRCGASEREMRDVIARVWALDASGPVGRWLVSALGL